MAEETLRIDGAPEIRSEASVEQPGVSVGIWRGCCSSYRCAAYEISAVGRAVESKPPSRSVPPQTGQDCFGFSRGTEAPRLRFLIKIGRT